MITLGLFLRQARKQAGVTQKNWGIRWGVAQSTVSDWERNRCRPRWTTLLQIIYAFPELAVEHLKQLAQQERDNAPTPEAA